MTANPPPSPPASSASTVLPPTRDARLPLWAPMLICAAAVVAFHNSFHGPFVFDDASSIVTNPTIQSISSAFSPPTASVTAQGRPILNVSLAINYALGGTAVEGYHLFNLAIHTLAGLALFGIVRRTLLASATVFGRISTTTVDGRISSSLALSLAVAVLWTVHPLQTQAVTYIIQRAESLVGLFYLLTLYCFVRAAGQLYQVSPVNVPTPVRAASIQAAGWLMLSVVACAIGMATKEVMATAPLMVLFFDRTFFAGTFLGALRQRRAFYAALTGTWLLLAWLIAQTDGNRGGSVGFGVGVGWWDYWLTQFKAIAHYLRLSFWPHPLVFEYGTFWIRKFNEIALPMLVVFSLLAATIAALWRRLPLGFLGAWFFGILAPTSLAPGTTQMIVEHRMYLPLAAVIVFVVVSLQGRLRGRARRPAGWLVAAAALALTFLTVRRNEDYRSDIALWTDTIVKRPRNPLAHYMLASAHEEAGNIPAAIAHYEQTLELQPDFSMGYEKFGRLLLRQGRHAEAIARFESALRLQPEFAMTHLNLGNTFLAEGRIAEAVGHLERAAELTPESPAARYSFGNALAAAGLTDEAVSEFETALQYDPGMSEAHFNLANAHVERSRTSDAIAHYAAAVKIRPEFAPAHYNLANALAASGRRQEAVEHYEAALRARPDYAEAHHNLGSALFELGQLSQAAAHYEAALRLAPDFPNARENLQRVRAQMERN